MSSSLTDNIVAIVPAAGTGKRFGAGTNKPFEMIGNKPVIMWPLETLNAMPEIKEIIPVMKETDFDYMTALLEQFKIQKVRRIVPGGKERQDSVFQGLCFIEDVNCAVLIHDGVRPFLEPRFVRGSLPFLEEYEGVVVGIPVKDTIKEVVDEKVSRTFKRELLWAIQTPQLFQYEPLSRAYTKSREESFYSTDDAALVEHYGGRVRVVRGSDTNIKITTPEDLMIAESILRLRGFTS